MSPENPFHNICFTLRLIGQLNFKALERAINEIVNRHEALRTTITNNEEGQPLQTIAPAMSLSLSSIDISEFPESKREVEVLRLISEQARRPFDLGRGPLLQTSLLREDDYNHTLLITMHNIVSDEYSVVVFIRELKEIYEAFSSGRPSPLPKLPTQYSEFILLQNKWLQDHAMDTKLNYWKQQLDNLPVLEIHTDHPRPKINTFHGATKTFELDTDLYEYLKNLSRQEEVPVSMLLMAAFIVLLHRYSGQLDIVVGSNTNNRSQPEIEGLIGCFENMLVIRTDLSGAPSFRELLGRVSKVFSGVYEHQDIPFAKSSITTSLILFQFLRKSHTSDEEGCFDLLRQSQR
ncbi:condensation domain-containing protein [Desulfobacterota bacterium AH_259_B03_O07]|nr:condensation domain-containing protein [Desulfobacterota bacterium AH_259_B03_O07]